jgi:hypothetical protein
MYESYFQEKRELFVLNFFCILEENIGEYYIDHFVNENRFSYAELHNKLSGKRLVREILR